MEDVVKKHKIVPLKLEWYDICKDLDILEGACCRKKTVTKHLLQSVSGYAQSGELMALMGPSGAGKTTLLNSLAKRQGVTSGKILLNGRKPPRNYNKISAYVMQDDKLFEVLTPRELFTFSATLRLPRGTTKEERDEMVQVVIHKLKMNTCADTRVGGTLIRGLSGGERKRTSIGYELITNPSLLFLDEPTTGLDSFTSLALIQSLRELAADGHTVICTIHQPSSDIWGLFDTLQLLVKGEVAYFGKASDSIEFFSSMGHPCPTYTNPADFFMALLQTQTDEQIARSQKIVKGMAPNLPKFQEVNPDDTTNAFLEKVDKIESVKRASYFTQVVELTRRGWRTVTRNPLTFRARLGSTTVMAILAGLVYLRLGYDQTNISDREGALFYLVMNQVFATMNALLLTFPLERALLVRERSNGMYSIGSYFLGKTISTIPLDIFFPVLTTCIVYFLIGFNTSSDKPFFYFLFAMFGVAYSASSFGIFLGCAFPSAELAVTIAPVIIIPFMLFGGFFVKLSTVVDWLSWIQYISIFKWGYQALIVNEMTGDKFNCTASELVTVADPPYGVAEVCPITDGSQVLESLGLTFDWDYWIAIGVLLGMSLGLRVLAYISLTIQTNLAVRRTQT